MSSLLHFNCEMFVKVVTRHLQVQDFYDQEFYHNLSMSPNGMYSLSGLILAAILSNQGFRVDVDQPMHGWFDATLGGISIRTMLKEDQLQAVMHHCEGLIAADLNRHPNEAIQLVETVDKLRSSNHNMQVSFTTSTPADAFTSKWMDLWVKQLPSCTNTDVHDEGIPTDTKTGKRKLS